MKRWLAALCGIVVLVVVAGAGLLAWYDGPRIQAKLTHELAERHGVILSMDHLERSYAFRPLVSVDGLRVANAKRARETLIEVQHARFRVHLLSLLIGPLTLDHIEIDGAHIGIPVDEKGVRYWEPVVDAISYWLHRFDWSLVDFSIRDFTLGSRHLQRNNDLLVSASTIHGRMPRMADLVIDASDVAANLETTLPFHLHGTAKLNRVVLDRRDGDLPMLLEADGHIENKPVSLRAIGGNLLDGDPRERDPVEGTLTVASRSAKFHGTMSRDDDLHVDLDVAVDLPGTDGDPSLRGRMHVGDPLAGWRMSDIHVERGDATLDGVVNISKSEHRRFFSVDLAVDKLHYPWTEQPDTEAGDGQADDDTDDTAPDNDLYANLVDFIGRFDADIRVAATDSSLYGAPLQDIATQATVNRGLFRFEVNQASLLDGALTSTFVVNPTGERTTLHLGARVRGARLATLTANNDLMRGTRGAFDGTVDLRGVGRSTDAVLKSMTGHLTLYLEDGAVPDKLATWMAGDVITALLADFDDESTTRVNCAIVDFDVNNGKAAAREMRLDAHNFTLRGQGRIDLPGRRLDIRLVPDPKKFTLFAMQLPVSIDGPFGDIDVDTDRARALASLLTPIDAGSGDDIDCNTMRQRAIARQLPVAAD